MKKGQRHTGRPLLALAALAFCCTGPSSRAQEADALEPEEVVVQPQPAFVVNEAQFDQWVFGGGVNASVLRARVERQLTLEIENIDRSCRLTDAQKKKLKLAAEGDIKRFFDRVEEKRAKFKDTRHDQNQVNAVFQEIRPLQATFRAGLFGPGSIFSKTIKKTLDEQQSAQYEKGLREKWAFQYQAKVDLMVATLGKSVGMSVDQRRRLAKLLMDETRPPKSFGQNEYQVMILLASKLPEGKLKPIFDDAQWRVVSRHFSQMKGMERFLLDNGYVPADAPDERGAKLEKAFP